MNFFIYLSTLFLIEPVSILYHFANQTHHKDAIDRSVCHPRHCPWCSPYSRSSSVRRKFLSRNFTRESLITQRKKTGKKILFLPQQIPNTQGTLSKTPFPNVQRVAEAKNCPLKNVQFVNEQKDGLINKVPSGNLPREGAPAPVIISQREEASVPVIISGRSVDERRDEVSDARRGFFRSFAPQAVKEFMKTAMGEHLKMLIRDDEQLQVLKRALHEGTESGEDVYQRGFLKSIKGLLPSGKDTLMELGKGLVNGATYEASHAIWDKPNNEQKRDSTELNKLLSALKDHSESNLPGGIAIDNKVGDLTGTGASHSESARNDALESRKTEATIPVYIQTRDADTDNFGIHKYDEDAAQARAYEGPKVDKTATLVLERDDEKSHLLDQLSAYTARDEAEARNVVVPAARILSAMLRRYATSSEEKNLKLPQFSSDKYIKLPRHDSSEPRNALDTIAEGANVLGKVVHEVIAGDPPHARDQGW